MILVDDYRLDEFFSGAEEAEERAAAEKLSREFRLQYGIPDEVPLFDRASLRKTKPGHIRSFFVHMVIMTEEVKTSTELLVGDFRFPPGFNNIMDVWSIANNNHHRTPPSFLYFGRSVFPFPCFL
jgi:hypothetical protein